MAVFAIAFSIGRTGDHEARRASMVEQIDDTFGSVAWRHDQSLVIGASSETADAIVLRIFEESLMDRERDKLLVIDLSNASYECAGGLEEDETLKNVMDEL